jgi:hypothetical protein
LKRPGARRYGLRTTSRPDPSQAFNSGPRGGDPRPPHAVHPQATAITADRMCAAHGHNGTDLHSCSKLCAHVVDNSVDDA